MKRFLILLSLLASPVLLWAQAPTAGFERLPSGIEYKLFRRDASGQYRPRPLVVPTDSTFSTRQGKFLLAHLTYLTGKDSVLQSTRRMLQNHPAPLPLGAVTKKGGQEEVLSLVLPGDSAVFRFRADSLFKGRPIPLELKRGGSYLVMQVVGVKVINQPEAMAMQQELQQLAMAEQQRQMRAYSAGQLAKDKTQILAYTKVHQLTTAKQLPGGTWYVITKRGTGPLPKTGEKVSVRYKGSLLATGAEFDASSKHGNTPFDFTLGRGEVIPGWDEGIAAVPKGSSAILLIPSPQAYGAQGSPPTIPPNSVLRFDIDLLGGTAAKPLDWVNSKMKQPSSPKKPAVKKAAPTKK